MHILFNAKRYQRLLPEPRISSSGDSQKPAAASWKLPELPLLNMATWEILLNGHGMSWGVMGCHGMSWDIYLQMLQM